MAGDGDQLGSVVVRPIDVLKPRRRIECRVLDDLTPHPNHENSPLACNLGDGHTSVPPTTAVGPVPCLECRLRRIVWLLEQLR